MRVSQQKFEILLKGEREGASCILKSVFKV